MRRSVGRADALLDSRTPPVIEWVLKTRTIEAMNSTTKPTTKPKGVSLKPSMAGTADHSKECSRCGLPVMLVWVNYGLQRKQQEYRHAETIKVEKIIEGGAKIEDTAVMLLNDDGSCPVPELSPYAKYLEGVSEYTIRKEHEGDQETMSEAVETGTAEPTKAQVIAKKIADAKAKKQATGTTATGKAVVEGKSANLGGVKAKAAKVKKAPKVKTPVTLNMCGCGCGAAVKSKFQMGHDARFHGWLKRLKDGRMKPTDLPPAVAKLLLLKKDGEGFVPKITEEQYLTQLEGLGGTAE